MTHTVRCAILTLDTGLQHPLRDDHGHRSGVKVLRSRGPVVRVNEDVVFNPVFTDIRLESFVELWLEIHKVIAIPGGPSFPKEIHSNLVTIDNDILDPQSSDLTIAEAVEQSKLDHKQIPLGLLP